MDGGELGHFSLLEKIGEGGMGQVYKARDTLLGRFVAIKLLPEASITDAARRARFVQEAKAASALNHPNILTIHEIGEQDDRTFIVMELVEGQPLNDLIPPRGMRLTEALSIAAQVADALAAAHAAGIVHRDLKPANIMIDAHGRAKVLDFGLAKLSAPAAPDQATRTVALEQPISQEGAIVGSVPYMSPEQAEGKPVDARSDIFSFGAVLYEMIAGRRAFSGDSAISTLTAIIRDEPKPLRECAPLAPARLDAIVRRCLRKDRDRRYPSAAALAGDLEACRAELSATSSGVNFRVLARQGRRPKFLIPALVALAALAWLGVRGYRHFADSRWAATEALPQIASLVGTDRIGDAYALAVKAEKYLPDDPMLEKFWPALARIVTIETTPPGAEVWRKDYDKPDAPWEPAGISPLLKVRVPRSSNRWKIEKKGYVTVEGLLFPNPFAASPTVRITLDKEGDAPAGMVRVPAGQTGLTLDIAGFEALPEMRVEDFWIDRYEVTNRQFKQFVDAGGYRTREYWKQPFLRAGSPIPWEEAVAQFRDATGRPGPAGWQQGDYPQGQADYPVSGVSWYEAAAYAQFAGKSLPTIWHCSHAAGIGASASVVPASNFGGQGPAPAGRFLGLGPWGTYDMAGNLKEWCWNQSKGEVRYILGGAWDEPVYMFTDMDARSPFDRLPNFGFRCVKYASSSGPGKTADAVVSPARDYSREMPCSDDLFRVYKSLFAYDRKPLNSKVEGVEETPDYRRQRVTFDAAYGNERVVAFLYLPKKSKPPLQALVYFPGSGVIQARALIDRYIRQIEFLAKSGRAVILPVLKGTLERGDELSTDYPNTTATYRDHVIDWSKDIGRSIDYLETRPEIDRTKVGFFGVSWGGAMGPIMSAVEDRIKVNVFMVPGFYLQRSLPEVDQINFTPRVKIPTLMLNGRFDFFCPVETSQLPMFRLLGTPKDQKRHVIYPTGHNIPRNDLIKESLDWLDRYLGPVQ